MTPQPKVVGVDLSLTGTGLCTGEVTWTIPSTGHRGASLAERRERLRRIRVDIVKTCREAALVVVEAPAFASQSGSMHDRSGHWWLVVDRLHALGVPVTEVPPSTLKKFATGKGNADKGAVIDAASRRYPRVETAGNSDRADALWLWAIGWHHVTGQSVVPLDHLAALAKVQWPAVMSAA